MKSKIFTGAELKALESYKKGNKKDPTGIFSSRVKPKILELFEWFKELKVLKKLLKKE